MHANMHLAYKYNNNKELNRCMADMVEDSEALVSQTLHQSVFSFNLKLKTCTSQSQPVMENVTLAEAN